MQQKSCIDADFLLQLESGCSTNFLPIQIFCWNYTSFYLFQNVVLHIKSSIDAVENLQKKNLLYQESAGFSVSIKVFDVNIFYSARGGGGEL